MEASGMDMGGGPGGNACKISMLWNWYTIDACFLSRSWHIHSNGAFAASCIGVVFLVMSLEALRRLSKEYDAYIIRARIRANTPIEDDAPQASSSSTDEEDNDANKNARSSIRARTTASQPAQRSFTPTLQEQMVRALLHLLQFTVAYIVMLLAMYYNGYIIICILIGAYMGAFIFGWESIKLPIPGQEREREITYCCG